MIDFSDRTVVVTEPLTTGLTRAANRGDIVHRESVEGHDEWDGKWAEHRTDEAIAALGYNPYVDDRADTSDVEPPTGYDSAAASVDDVLEHVTQHPDQAAGILEAELQREQPRRTLVDKLEKLLAS